MRESSQFPKKTPGNLLIMTTNESGSTAKHENMSFVCFQTYVYTANPVSLQDMKHCCYAELVSVPCATLESRVNRSLLETKRSILRDCRVVVKSQACPLFKYDSKHPCKASQEQRSHCCLFCVSGSAGKGELNIMSDKTAVIDILAMGRLQVWNKAPEQWELLQGNQLTNVLVWHTSHCWCPDSIQRQVVLLEVIMLTSAGWCSG